MTRFASDNTANHSSNEKMKSQNSRVSDVSWNGQVDGSATRCQAGNYGNQGQPGVSPKGATTQPDVGIHAKDLVRQP